VGIQGIPSPGSGLRLHLNENTGGCSPHVLEAIHSLTATDVSTYPDYARAVDACAQCFDVDPDWVLLVNGLDEGILMTAVAHVARARAFDAEVILPVPAFDPYVMATSSVGAAAVRVAPGPDFTFPTDAVLQAVTTRTRLIFLNTPSNPTGRLIAPDDIARIAEATPHAVVLVDEAYIEFGGETFLPSLGTHQNVLVGRTFSKAYGLAGMRIGCLIGHPDILDPVRAVTPPLTVNIVAVTAFQAALEDSEFLPAYAAQVVESRELLYTTCRRLGLRCWDSAANFVLVEVGDPAAAFVEVMGVHGVHVRDRSADPYTPGCVRITAGVVAHTERAIKALEAAVAARQEA
jgi:histidinol-phosphate aminotransferase